MWIETYCCARRHAGSRQTNCAIETSADGGGDGRATLIALLTAVFRLKGEFFRIFAVALPQMLILALACLLPYLLWAAALLPQFGYAQLASTVLVAFLFVVFYPKSRPKPSTAAEPGP